MKTYSSVIVIAFCLLAISCATQSPVATTPMGPGAFKALMGRGMMFLENGETGKAIDEFSKACAAEPASAKPRNFLGMAYFKQNDFAKAAEQFNKAIELDGSFASAYNNLGSVYLFLKKYDEARALFSKVLTLDPKNASAYFSLGNILLLQGQEEEGVKYLTKALELDPSFLDRQGALFSSLSFTEPGETMFNYAKAFAASGNVDQTASYLSKARTLGFKDWGRILNDKEFEAVRQDKKISEFIKF
jgi:tetratricopeptide (TPR) repeat protein